MIDNLCENGYLKFTKISKDNVEIHKLDENKG